MFSVYGKSRQGAKKIVDKLLLNKKSKISVKLSSIANGSQQEKQDIIDSKVNEIFVSMKCKRCTHEFSTPYIAKEAFDIMVNDHKNYSDLTIMKKRPKKTKSGGVSVSKSTGKVLTEWVPLHED